MRLVAMTSSFFYGKMYVEGYSMKNDKYDLSKTLYVETKQNFDEIHYVTVLGGARNDK